MKMSKVSRCDVTDCAYNIDNKCHTPAITVGDIEPRCDTFIHSSQKAGDIGVSAGVGACKVEACSHNAALECQLGSIVVGYSNNQPDCLSYKKR